MIDQVAKRKKRIYSKKNVKWKGIPKEQFSFLRFVMSFRAEILAIVFVIIGVRIISFIGVKKDLQVDVDLSLSEVSSEQRALWQKQYPSGYKIIAIADKKIIPTEQDTLPEDLIIDWHNVLVSLVPADPLRQVDEKVKITIPIISYAPVNIYNLSVSAIFSRGQRERVGLAKFGWHSLMVEVIGEDGDKLYCLIGFQ